MAAFYSQNPFVQAALARERLQATQLGQLQQQQQLEQSAAAAAALSQLPGRAAVSAPGLGLPGLAGLLGLPTGPAAGLGDTTSRTDLFRDYLSKLAQSSLTSPTSLPQYLSSVSSLSTSSLIKADSDIKTENPLPASLRPGRNSTSSNRYIS